MQHNQFVVGENISNTSLLLWLEFGCVAVRWLQVKNKRRKINPTDVFGLKNLINIVQDLFLEVIKFWKFYFEITCFNL